MDMRNAAATLRWWAEAGVDTFVDDTARDWLAAVQNARPAPAEQPATGGKNTPSAPPETLEAFVAWLADPATLAPLGPRRAAPQGNPASGVMLLSDMPESDALMDPLGGMSGRLLDRMLAALGRDRASVYLAALCPARPTGGRLADPLRTAVADAARRHVALAAPRCLLLMGQAAVAAFGLEWPAARGRKHIVHHDTGTVTAIATFHPRFLLAQPACKADAWADLRLLLTEIEA